jgi:transposase
LKSSSECHLRRLRAQARRNLTRIRKLGTIVRAIVERTIGWLTTNRRLAKDYERLIETGEMLLYLAMSRILLRRLTRKER